MKILTLNAHAWMEEDPYDKIETIIDRIAAQAYRFVALQEINQSMDAGSVEDETFIIPSGDVPAVDIKADNFALLIVKGLRDRGLNYYWSWTANHIGYDRYDEGVAVLSLLPFDAVSLRVSESDDYAHHYTRRVLKATTTTGLKKWSVISGHYSWWTDPEGTLLFQNEWDNTLKLLKNDADTSFLVMGDFNNEASVRQEGYDYVKETAPELMDAYTSAAEKIGEATVVSAIDGWDDHADDKRIDYIFTDMDLQVQRYRVVFDGQNGPVVSDHFGIEAELRE